jgi:NADP-dependent 3-hydroxy acid dehydrogenase YdfG
MQTNRSGKITMSNVDNKVVVITGASSGIGAATARLLSQNGAKVVLGARRTEKLEQIVKEIRATGGTAEFKAVEGVYSLR